MEKINSIFDIYNKNETGLSRSLAAIIYSDHRIIKYLLKDLLKANNYTFSSVDIKNLETYIEFTENKNRYDIFCKSENYAIIIETKIGSNTVDEEQRDKYIAELKNHDKKYKILIQIIQFDNQEKYINKKKASVKVINISWIDILEIIKRSIIEINVSKEFENYIIRSLDMNIFDMNVWAVVVSDPDMKKLKEQRIYLNAKHHQPVFIGFREWDNNLKRVVVKELYPVLNVLPHDSPEAKKYKNIRDRLREKEEWLYFLGDPISLKNPSKNKFPLAGAIKVDFSELGDNYKPSARTRGMPNTKISKKIGKKSKK